MLNTADLQRVRAEKAAACLILADKFCEDPDSEDAANIMRVIRLEYFHPNMACIFLWHLLKNHNIAVYCLLFMFQLEKLLR